MIHVLLALLLNSVAPFAQADAATSRPADPQAGLKVMTFNIRFGTAGDGPNHWTHRRDMVFDVLRKYEPDLVGMQEVLRFQLDEVLAARPGFAAIGVGRDDGKSAGEHSPILYRKDRFRLLEHGTFWLSESPEVPGSKSWKTGCTRLCTWARFRDNGNGRTFYFYNTHLDNASQEAREKGVSLILQRMRERKHADPVFLTGDFNSGEDNPVPQLVAKAGKETSSAPMKLRDSFRIAHPEEKIVGTFNHWTGRKDGPKIDYVFVPEAVEVRSAEIIRDNTDGRYPSDHFPVIAVVEW